MLEDITDLYGMKVPDLYAPDWFSLDSLAVPFGEQLGLRFQLRESSFIGEYLTANGMGARLIDIQYNSDIMEDYEPLYAEYEEYRIIITVETDGVENADALKIKILQLKGVTFLQRKIWPDVNPE